MELQTWQILLISLYAGIAALTELPIRILPLTFGMPHLVGPIVGLILGDLAAGLIVGISIELIMFGLTSIGGVVPPDKIIATVLGTVFVVVGGMEVETALTVVLPAALIGQLFGIATQTINSFLAHWADSYAEKGNPEGISMIMWLGNLLLFLVRFVPVLIALSFGIEPTQRLIAAVPAWLATGIQVGGTLLPTVGFALLLVMIIKREGWAWLLLGFILASVLNMNAITIAIVAGAAAIIITLPKLRAQSVN